MKNLVWLLLFCSLTGLADVTGGGISDYFGNPISSRSSGSQWPLDIGINVSGTVVDPRTRTWNLSSSDVPACTQSGTWNINNISGTVTLPTLAATSTKQSDGTQKTQVVDASGNVQPSGDSVARGIFTKITDGTSTSTVAGYGALRVSPEANSIFYDPFDSTLDTTDKWNTPITSGGGSVAQGTGGLITSTGTAASSYGYITSKPTFVGTVPGYAQIGYANKFEATSFITGAYRFFGVGTNPAVPTTTAPMTDGVGWDIDTTGHFCAVVYASGVRTVIADLTTLGTAKTDGNYHRYVMFMRTDKTFWYIDSLDVPVAVSSFQFPTIQQLSLSMLSVNGGSVQATAPKIISTGIGIGDTGHTSVSFSDGAAPWRKATIKAASTAAVAADLALVVTMSPNNTTTVQGSSGTPGTPSGGIMTVQGVTGGSAVPVSSAPGSSGTPTQTSVSCATSSTTLLAASTATKFISIRNPTSATATVWVNLTGSAAVAAAPSVDLAPGSEADFYASENSYLPTAQINCISGGASASTLTLIYK